jgi:hypothetical protein
MQMLLTKGYICLKGTFLCIELLMWFFIKWQIIWCMPEKKVLVRIMPDVLFCYMRNPLICSDRKKRNFVKSVTQEIREFLQFFCNLCHWLVNVRCTVCTSRADHGQDLQQFGLTYFMAICGRLRCVGCGWMLLEDLVDVFGKPISGGNGAHISKCALQRTHEETLCIPGRNIHFQACY